MSNIKTPIEIVAEGSMDSYKQLLKENVNNTGYEIASTLGTTEMSSVETKKEMAKLLSQKRQQVNFMLDGAKLNQAMKNMAMIEQMSSVLSDPEVIQRVRDGVKTPYDFKQLADAQKTFIKNMSDLNALDTLDESGTSARLNLAVSLKNADGSSTQVVIQQK